MPSTPRELLTSDFEAASFEAPTEDGPCDLVRDVARDVTFDGALGGALDGLTAGLSAGETAMALLALSEHAGALRLVWEAHARGAITLPPSVVRRVMQARRAVPPFLMRQGGDIVGEASSAAATVVVFPSGPSIR